MTAAERLTGRNLIDGTILIVSAEALILPAGLVTAGLISRRLGVDGFGLFSVALSTVTWLEWTVNAVFARSVIKLISDAEDWRPLGSAVLRLMGLIGLALGLLMWLLAGPLAAGMNEPRLAGLLALLALDIPIFCVAQAHRLILIGQGRYRQRASVSAARLIGRTVLVVALVELGFGVSGAIAGHIVSTLIELAFERLYVRPPLRAVLPVDLSKLWAYSLPLFLSSFGVRFYDRLDLMALKILGGTVEQAGLYSAAQRVALVPIMLIFSFSPLLMSTLGHWLRLGNARAAAQLERNALRVAFGVMPIAALLAGSSTEVMRLAFGPGFDAAGPLLARLLLAVLGVSLISVCISVLTAHSRPLLVLAVTGPLLPLAIVGHVLLIPRFGPAGAALVTASTAWAGALACLTAAWRAAGLRLPGRTLLRALAVSAGVYFLAAIWATPGLWLLVKLAVLTIAAGLGFVALGEIGAAELAQTWAYIRQPMAIIAGEAHEAR